MGRDETRGLCERMIAKMIGMYIYKTAHYFKSDQLHHISPLYWGKILNEMASSTTCLLTCISISVILLNNKTFTTCVHTQTLTYIHTHTCSYPHLIALTLIIHSFIHPYIQRPHIHSHIHSHIHTSYIQSVHHLYGTIFIKTPALTCTDTFVCDSHKSVTNNVCGPCTVRTGELN